MRIRYSPRSDVMIVDTVSGLNALHERLKDFIASDQRLMNVPTGVSGDPAPYAEFLPGLVVEKTNGPVMVATEPDRTLSIRGSAESLSVFAQYFHFRPDQTGSHRHPEHGGALSIIIEADAYYEMDLTGES